MKALHQHFNNIVQGTIIMKVLKLLLVFISLAGILNSSILLAQEGTSKIRGKVIDTDSGEPLFGANVILNGTSLGAATDIEGDYLISNVPAGKYRIQFKYLGYKEVVFEDVDVANGKTITLDAKLSFEAIVSETIVVTAQGKGQIDAINRQLSSNSIKNIVAKDRIQEVPDVNAAESIGRLPGVSLQRSGGEGNKIIVRGLSPQYNTVEIDGVKLSGVDLDRSVGLSIISNEMLEGIELSKSLTPDKDADALGGTVNLTMKEADMGLHFNLLAQGSYNNLRTDYGNYKFSGRISDRFFDNSLGVIANLGTEKINRSSDIFGADYGTYLGQQDVLQTNNAHIEQAIDDRYRGFLDVVLDYKTEFIDLKMTNLYSRQEDENENRNNLFIFDNNEFDFQIWKSNPIETIRSHSLAGGFSFWDTELNLDAAYSKSELENYHNQFNFRDQDILSQPIPPSARVFQQPSTLISQYYNIAKPKTAILWENLMTTTNRKDETYTYNLDWKIPYNLTNSISGNIRAGGRFSDKQRSSEALRREAPYYGGRGREFISSIKAGNIVPGLLYNTDVGIPRPDGIPAVNWVVDYDWQNILDGRYNMGYSVDYDELEAFSNSIFNYKSTFITKNGIETYRNSYENREKKTALYIMTEVNIGQSLMLLPGVRYEKMNSTYSSYFIQVENESVTGVKYTKPITAETENEHWFPSINAKFEINEWSDLRAAYFRSCARPNYLQLSPALVANPGKTELTGYNWSLKPAIANNFDLIYSIYSNEIGLLSINGFYKEIDGLISTLPSYQPHYFDRVQEAPAGFIESLQEPRELYDPTLITGSAQNWPGFPFNNPHTTYFRGFELNFQTYFWYLPGLLSTLVLDVNYSKIWSKTRLPYLEIVTTYDTTKIIPVPVQTPYYRTSESRMIDQPADILNVRIGWDYKGFSTRVSFRYQGEVLSRLDQVHSLLNGFSKSQFFIDLAVKQELFEHLSLMLDASNINQYIDDATIRTQGLSFPTSSSAYGLVTQLSLRYEY